MRAKKFSSVIRDPPSIFQYKECLLYIQTILGTMALPMLRTSLSLVPSTAVRSMATLKDIETRLKSVKNIKKITSSMKMVSAAKFTRAEKALKVCYSHFY